MSQAVTKGAHWLKRQAQFSTHGQRNGRVDVLPQAAKDPLYEDFERRREVLVQQLREAEEERAAAIKHNEKLNGIRSAWALRKNQLGIVNGDHELKPPQLVAAELRCTESRRAVAAVQSELTELNVFMGTAGQRPQKILFANAFIIAAKILLDKAAFERIQYEASRIMKTDPQA